MLGGVVYNSPMANGFEFTVLTEEEYKKLKKDLQKKKKYMQLIKNAIYYYIEMKERISVKS